MSSDEILQRRQKLIDEFNGHEKRGDGATVAGSLSGGLTLVRDSLYARIHDDVEGQIGLDSMLMPPARAKSERAAKLEIEVYQAAVSAAAVAEWEYLGVRDDWYSRWLCRLRLDLEGEDPRAIKRLEDYLARTPDGRRLAFTNVLARVWPESRRAPLVLFRLVAPAVRIVTSLAFGDHAHALAMREAQIAILPPIRDCHACHGSLLENGEQCAACGNPLWKYEWLIAAD